MSLSERSISAVKWSYLGIAARVVAQTVVQIALARLLGPDSLGVFALAFLVIGLVTLVAELGLGATLVQKHTITRDDVRIVYSRVVAASVITAALLFLCAPLAPTVMGDPRAAALLQALASIPILQAFGVAPLSLLKRDLAFKQIQLVQVGSYLAGFAVVGLPMAILGYGTWSLVAAWLSQASVASVSYYLLRPHSLVPTFCWRDQRLGGFGFRVMLTNITNWSIENIDNFVVGRLFGAGTLGYYAVSYNFVRTPSNHIVVALQNVLFPASARAQQNLPALRRTYLTVAAGVTLTTVPMFVSVSLVSETVVTALFGADWAPAASMLAALAIAMTFHSLMAIAGPILWGQGSAHVELRVQLLTAVVLTIALVVAGQVSPIALAWAVSGVYAVRLVAMTVALGKHIELDLATLWDAVRGGVLGGLMIASALAILDQALAVLGPIHRLVILIGCGSTGLSLYVVLLPRLALSEHLAYALIRALTAVPRSQALQRRIKTAFPSLEAGTCK